MQITSSAYAHACDIPTQYTCEGDDVSPPLSWNDVPTHAMSLVLIIDDPDAPDPAAPRMVWAHWLLYNLPPDCTGLAEAIADSALPAGTRQGRNDWNRTGYGGPCPPVGRHRYVHKLYALDIVLPDLKDPNKQKLEQAMQGHIIEQSELVAFYEKA